MYETDNKIITQKFTKNISYTIHPFPGHIAMYRVQTSIAINITYYTERQQFSAVTASFRFGFLKVFKKNLKFGLLRLFLVFFV